ncbi:MAG: PD-(D/E)XK nuclease family protein [bacterium]|nr:PD-(D/E)XK nuclease family protein [bacterium]
MIRRVNVTFAEAFLPRVAEEVLARAEGGTGKVLACERVVVVVPGQRAARRVLELLSERAHKEGRLLIPPRVCTPHQFCVLISSFCGVTQIASEVEELAAWMHAIEGNRELASHIIQRDESEVQWSENTVFGMAQAFRAAYNAVTGENLTCAEVVAQCEGHDVAQARWRGLDTLAQAMREVLAKHGLRTFYAGLDEVLRILARDPTAVRRAVSAIIVAGVVDPFAYFTRCLQALGSAVIAMSFGPEDAGWFDDTGGLRWREELVFGLLDDVVESIVCTDAAADQAHTVVEWLRGVAGGYALTDVVIGVPDPDVSRALRAALALEGVTTHDAVGTPFLESSLGVLLTALVEFLEEPMWSAGLRLVRHPVMEAFVRRGGGGRELTAAEFAQMVEVVEQYLTEHLVPFVTPERPRDADTRVEEAVTRLTRVLGDMLAQFTGMRGLAEWVTHLNECLAAWYGDTEVEETDEDEALRIWGELSSQVETARVQAPGQLSAPSALRLLLAMARGLTLAPPRTGPAVDLVGWLELALDDAPVMAVTGMNEGIVSESVVTDAFLPDSLRERLGLPCNRRRWIRDRYLLRVIVRSGKRFLLTTGRAANTGDPLRISRVLCDLSPAILAELLLRFYGKSTAAQALTPQRTWAPAAAPLSLAPPSDKNLSLPVAWLYATEFAVYLACPYKFYLRRTVGEPTAPPTTELSSVQFGMLLHEVLASFGRHGPHHSTNASEIAAWLHTELTRLAQRQFGHTHTLALEVQLAACRQRLTAFAARQAAHAAEGWQLLAAETQQGLDATLDGMPIRVRVDRIDRHEQDGVIAILDYKTGEVIKPDKKACVGGDWVDLQLPLYWHAATCGDRFSGAVVRVGYFFLPSSSAQTRVEFASWAREDYESALACAREVIAKVRAQVFARTDDHRHCARCPYSDLCQRK